MMESNDESKKNRNHLLIKRQQKSNFELNLYNLQ